MNILFMSLLDFCTFDERNIYTDLLRELKKHGHTIYCVSPDERNKKRKTSVICENGSYILKQRIGNIQKVHVIEKGISTLLIEHQFMRGIRKHFRNVHFDLVVYSTPPITFAKVIRYIKKRDRARTYLLLKDIFPQNSVDLGMLSTHGCKGLIYRYFRSKERELYAISDQIGCMSPANCSYVLTHNPEISPEKVEMFPNSIELVDMRLSDHEKREMRVRYGLPLDKKVFVYGGNLGRPQDVPFIVACLQRVKTITDAYFVVAGNGTDRHYLEEYVANEQPTHLKLFRQLPKAEYDRMVACCDVGLIFLDHRFTIPNFPSRLLAYMQAGLPVLTCIDSITDVGDIVCDGQFGWQCRSDSTDEFCATVQKICDSCCLDGMSENAYRYLCEHYLVETLYERLFAHD